jgi:hypothetical protein
MGKYFSRERVGYMFRVLTNPADSFYEIRYREQGSVPLALICVFALSTLFTINRIFAGFIVNDINPRSVNGVQELIVFLLFVALISIGNWSITCLMNGEGRFKDILTVVGYSMLPLVLTLGPATVLSRVISEEEAGFYTIMLGIAIAWTAILLLTGIMTVHNYTLAKTLVTLFLTFITVLILIFIGMLIISLISQLYKFIYSIYTELAFRF